MCLSPPGKNQTRGQALVLTFLRSLASLTLCKDMAFPERVCCTTES